MKLFSITVPFTEPSWKDREILRFQNEASERTGEAFRLREELKREQEKARALSFELTSRKVGAELKASEEAMQKLAPYQLRSTDDGRVLCYSTTIHDANEASYRQYYGEGGVESFTAQIWERQPNGDYRQLSGEEVQMKLEDVNLFDRIQELEKEAQRRENLISRLSQGKTNASEYWIFSEPVQGDGMDHHGPYFDPAEAMEAFEHHKPSFDGASLYMNRVMPPEGERGRDLVDAADAETYADEFPNIKRLREYSTRVATLRWEWAKYDDPTGDVYCKSRDIEYTPEFLQAVEEAKQARANPHDQIAEHPETGENYLLENIEREFCRGNIEAASRLAQQYGIPDQAVAEARQRAIEYHEAAWMEASADDWDNPEESYHEDSLRHRSIADYPQYRGKDFGELAKHYHAECHRINEESDGEAWGNASEARDMGERFSVLHAIQEAYQQGNIGKVESLIEDHRVPLEDVEEAKRRGLAAEQIQPEMAHQQQRGGRGLSISL
jgi:hypothetical protein